MGWELFISLVVVVVSPSVAGSAGSPKKAPQMIKSLVALTIFVLLGVSVIAIPGFAPRAKADEAVALAKGDRLPIHLIVSKLLKPDLASH